MTQVFEPLLLREHRGGIVTQMRELLLPPETLAETIIAYQLGLADRDGNGTSEDVPAPLVRPSLCLWAVGACGADAIAMRPLAVSMELLYNFTLIHNDIQDGAGLRPEREAVWEIWGLGQAVNAGDALHSLALSVLSHAALGAAQTLHIFTRVVTAVNESITGKSLDLDPERYPPGARAYLRCAFNKTGALMGASLEAGALAARASEPTVSRLRRAGRLLGVAFQLGNDMNDSANESVNPHVKAGDLAERCTAQACALVARSGVSGVWLQRFEEMAEYIAKRTR